MTTLRTFIAIHISDAAQAALTQLQQRLKAVLPLNTVRWTAPQNIHLTLHFLGDVPQHNIEAIINVLDNVVLMVEPFDLTLSGIGCFPSMQKPGVLWVDVTGQIAPLKQLQAELGRQLQTTIGFLPDTRPYTPHLTLGRVQQDVSPAQLSALAQSLLTEQAKIGQLARFRVTGIGLIRSELKPAGSVYTVLHWGEFRVRS